VNPADPIIACATGHTTGLRSARAIIRLSAPELDPILSAHLTAPAPRTRSISRAELRLSPSTTLPILLLRFPAPRSATGQDVAELLVPGNPALVHRILTLFHHADPPVRPALPGEFTARALLAGRITAEQAEGVQALIGARTDAEHIAAQSLLSGDTGAAYRTLADELAATLALVEAGIDFTDQDDVVAITPADLATRIDTIRAALADMVRGSSAALTRDRPIRIVLAGPPNAGKSTLFNRLLAGATDTTPRARAIVSDAAGTTRDAIVEPISARSLAGAADATWHDLLLELADLAGLDGALGARSPSDAAAQSAAHHALSTADVILWCDPTGAFADPVPIPPHAIVLRLRTKADLSGPLPLPGRTGFQPVSETTPHPFSGGTGFQPVSDTLPICALDGRNLTALRRAILDAALTAARTTTTDDTAAALLPRHHAALTAAMASLDAARAQSPSQPEAIAAHLRAALDNLGSICGRIHPDDIIGRIFATFCIGK
jgi:tRNA modification GTPase